MLTILNNPVHLNGHAPSQSGAAATNPAPSPAHPATPPPDLTPEEDFQLLRAHLNPDFDNFQVCELCGITPSQHIAWLNLPHTQQRIAEQTQLSEARAKQCASMAQPKAVAVLEHILAAYTQIERDQPIGRDPVALGIRQRHRESARRAAWLILKVTGAIPVHIRAARPKDSRPDAEPDGTSRPVPPPQSPGQGDPSLFPTAEPAFAADLRRALDLRKVLDPSAPDEADQAAGATCQDHSEPPTPTDPPAQSVASSLPQAPAGCCDKAARASNASGSISCGAPCPTRAPFSAGNAAGRAGSGKRAPPLRKG